jgi:hypothetical protein
MGRFDRPLGEITMHILSHKNINLHSASSPGGLIHIAAGTSKVVPDDVLAHPGFEILVRSGQLVKLAAEPVPTDVHQNHRPDPPKDRDNLNIQATAEKNADLLRKRAEDEHHHPGKTADQAADGFGGESAKEAKANQADDERIFAAEKEADAHRSAQSLREGTRAMPSPADPGKQPHEQEAAVHQQEQAGEGAHEEMHQYGREVSAAEQKKASDRAAAEQKTASDKAAREQKAASDKAAADANKGK